MGNDEAAPPSGKKQCLVVMGFGKKTDFETGRTLDLDKTYRNIIKPAVTAAGLDCIRADEIVHHGMIDVPMFDLLLKADVVVADISTSNKNAFYELGVRHALRPHTTIIISEDGIKSFPFDVNHVAVRQYHHMGDGIDFGEVERFRELLRTTIEEVLSKEPAQVDSPVYTFLPELNPPTLGERVPAAPKESKSSAALKGADDSEAVTAPPAPPTPPELSPQSKALLNFVERVEQAVAQKNFSDAKNLLAEALKFLISEQSGGPIVNTPDVLLRLVNAGRAVEGPNRHETLTTARRIFEFLSPTRSNNPDTLQLLGDIEFALFEEKNDVNRLRRAREAYERLHTIRRDYRSGITLAYLVTLHAEYRKDPVDKLTDIGSANRLRREVVESCNEKLVRIDERVRTEMRLISEQGQKWTPAVVEAAEEKLEVWAALAEAYYGLGDIDNYHLALDVDEALLIQGGESAIKATEVRIKRLAPLLENQSSLVSTVKNGLENGHGAGPTLITPTARPAQQEAEAVAVAPANETGRERNLIFFSYSHHNERDKEILSEIKKTLSPIFQGQTIQMWDDGHIEPGQEWEKEIKSALARAKGAVLIVSNDFLNSDFISKQELPVILKGVEEAGIKLMWIAAEKTFVKKTKLSKYQALHDPDETLDSYTGKEFKDRIFDICEKIDQLIFPEST